MPCSSWSFRTSLGRTHPFFRGLRDDHEAHPDRPGPLKRKARDYRQSFVSLTRKCASFRPGSCLLWQAEFADQILEAGIGVQKVEFGVRFDCNRKVLLVLVEALL